MVYLVITWYLECVATSIAMGSLDFKYSWRVCGIKWLTRVFKGVGLYSNLQAWLIGQIEQVWYCQSTAVLTTIEPSTGPSNTPSAQMVLSFSLMPCSPSPPITSWSLYWTEPLNLLIKASASITARQMTWWKRIASRQRQWISTAALIFLQGLGCDSLFCSAKLISKLYQLGRPKSWSDIS